GPAFGESRAVDGRECLLVAERRHEVQVAAATDGWHGFQRARMHALYSAPVGEMKAVDSFGVVEVCVHVRIVPVVEQEETAVTGEKGFHGIARIVGDHHPLRALESAVPRRGNRKLRARRQLDDSNEHDPQPAHYAYSHRRAKRRAIRNKTTPDPISTPTCGARCRMGSSRLKTLV